LAQSSVLITSGTYVSAEIAAEFGRIPPAFLPIGNRRLYAWQIEEIRARLPDARVVMSLPDDFEMDSADAAALQSFSIEVTRAPADLSLGQSLTYVILAANLVRDSLCMLHGDTLLFDFPLDRIDTVSVGVTQAYYPWADYEVRDGGGLVLSNSDDKNTDRHVLTGAFHLSDVPLFLRGLAQSDNSFLRALEFYSARRGLAPVSSGKWFDFGHLHTYFQSRRAVTTARHFNRLETEDHFFVKSSSNRAKIEAEREWFCKLPAELRIYTPGVLPAADVEGGAAYRIEYCYLTTLNDIFVFGRLPPSVWRRIFDACSQFLDLARRHRPDTAPTADGLDLYLDKTLTRLRQFAEEKGLDLDTPWSINGAPTPSLRQITERLAAKIGAADDQNIATIHGDFCFSNILFDFRTQRIKVIDPRGLDNNGHKTPYGDVRYETAKLHHSVIGLYDHIIAGRFQVASQAPYDLTLTLPSEPGLLAVQQLFMDASFGGRTLEYLKAHEISILLFLSMLPLHADNPTRQWALLANALRLYRLMDTPA
jgi:hypothetical protein